MSDGPRIVLGAVALCFAIGFGYLGTISESTAEFLIGAFCGTIALACLVKRARSGALRVIGGVLCVLFLFHVATSIGTKGLGRAIAGLCVVGIPGGYLAVTGKYPDWGHGSAAFQGKRREDE